MKNVKRSIRRHHAERLKSNRKMYWGKAANSSKRLLGLCISTPCVCSCWMCGNQRKHYGASISDKKRNSIYESSFVVSRLNCIFTDHANDDHVR